MPILPVRNRAANAITAAVPAGAAQVAARVRRRVIVVRDAMIAMIAERAAAPVVPVAVRQVRVDVVRSRADSVGLAGSVMIVTFVISVRRSRRHRACRW